jgi:hypothetical protein
MQVKMAPIYFSMQITLTLHAESVSPERGLHPGPPALRVHVGGVPEYYERHMPGLRGCLRGLRIGDKLLNLEGASGRHDHGELAQCPVYDCSVNMLGPLQASPPAV